MLIKYIPCDLLILEKLRPKTKENPKLQNYLEISALFIGQLEPMDLNYSERYRLNKH